MTTSKAILVSNELYNMGFNTRIIAGKVVRVWLDRKVSIAEVETALRQVFDEIEFKLAIDGNGVMVR